MPPSRMAKSAKNKWWLITTTSAAMASLRAAFTWHSFQKLQVEPKQLSRLEVIKGISGERSSSVGISAKSPVRVVLAQVCTCAKVLAEVRSGKVGACCAMAKRCWQT